MVLPLVDEHKPKCYFYHQGFENIEDLRKHQNSKDCDFFEENKKQTNREPAPGDVTVF